MHWPDDELILLARLEVQLTVTGGVRAMNQRLAVAFTGRSLQAIKGVRRASNLRYRWFFNATGANAGGANAAAEGLPAAAGAGPQGVPYVSLTPVDVAVNDAIAAGIARRPRRAAVPEGRIRLVAVCDVILSYAPLQAFVFLALVLAVRWTSPDRPLQ